MKLALSNDEARRKTVGVDRIQLNRPRKAPIRDRVRVRNSWNSGTNMSVNLFRDEDGLHAGYLAPGQPLSARPSFYGVESDLNRGSQKKKGEKVEKTAQRGWENGRIFFPICFRVNKKFLIFL